MAKLVTVKIAVPSKSRPISLLKWLGDLLKPHNMTVMEVHDEESGVTAEKQDG